MLNGRSRGGSLQHLKLVLAGSTGSCNASQVCHINNRFKHTYNLYLQYLQVLNSKANESLLLVGWNTPASTLQLFWTEKCEINLEQPPDKLSRSKRSVPSGPCMNHGDEFMGWVSSLNFPIYFPQQLMLKRKQKTSSIAQAYLQSFAQLIPN